MHRNCCQGRNSRRVLCMLVMVLTVFGVVVEQAAAHKVTVFAWVEGDTVHTESKFSGGRYAKQARIEVYDSSGNQLLDGRTDDKGRFVFKAPKVEDLQIVLMAGAGHRNEWVVKAEEFSGQVPLMTKADSVQTHATPPLVETSLPADLDLTHEDLQRMIEAALDKKLQPVLHRLHQMDEGPRLADIMGGIGYILGLVGLGTYIHYRRRSSSEGTHAG